MNVFTNRVKKFIILTNKIQKILFDYRKNKIFYENTSVALRTGGTKLKPVEVFVSVDFRNLKHNGAQIPESNGLTSYDREIHNAVISLYDVNNKYFSPSMILNVLSGNNIYQNGVRKNVTPNISSEILSSLYRMMQTSININASEEGRAFNKEEYNYSGNLLPIDFVDGVSLNNNFVRDCINIFRKPPLLEYSQLRRQLSNIDVELLGVLSSRSNHILIRDYLLSEILWMKYSKQRKQVIRYDTLQEYLCLDLSGNEDEINHKRKNLRGNVMKCLDYWITKKFIKGYKEEKERNLFSKVLIKF